MYFNEKGWEFDRVVGLARGGLFPAVIISHLLNLPMTAIHYSSKEGEGEYKMYDNHKAFDLLLGDRTERLLIVDDICDSGHTLKEVVELLSVIKVPPIITYSVFFKERNPEIFRPTYHSKTIAEDSPWIIFPYEQS